MDRHTSDLDRIEAELDASRARVRSMLAACEAHCAALAADPCSTVQCGGTYEGSNR